MKDDGTAELTIEERAEKIALDLAMYRHASEIAAWVGSALRLREACREMRFGPGLPNPISEAIAAHDAMHARYDKPDEH